MFSLNRDIDRKGVARVTPVHLVRRDFCLQLAAFVIFNNLVILASQLATVSQNVALAILVADRLFVLVMILTWCAGGYLRHCYIFHWNWVTTASDNHLVFACRAVPLAVAAALMGIEVTIKYLRHGQDLALSYQVC